MTFVLPIISSLNPAIPPTLIEVPDAPNFRRAKRTALFIARTQRHIVKPVVFDPGFIAAQHAAAVQFRQTVLAAHSPKMPDVSGPRNPFWLAPTRVADCYDGR